MDGLGLTDDDLMIDLRLGSSKEIQNVYKANATKRVEITAAEMKEKKQRAEKEFAEKTKGRQNLLSNGEAYAEYVLGPVAEVAPDLRFDFPKPG